MRAATPRTFNLTAKEQSAFGARGYVGVVEFHRGPRGGKYRPVRTHAVRELDEAIRQTEALAARLWNVPVKSTDVFVVDSQGRVYPDADLSSKPVGEEAVR